MSMLPNYILAIVLSVFLIYKYISIKVNKVRVENPIVFAVGIVIAILLLGMSVYGIIFNIPLGQVQHLIEKAINL